MELGLLPYQMQFLQSEAEELAFIGGVGTGKTYTGALFAITETVKNPHMPGIIVASTYGQLQSATLVHLKRLCEETGIHYKYNQQKGIVTINSTEHFVRSSELFDNSRGLEGSWLWVDEAAYSDEKAIDMFIGRVRYRGGSLKKRYTSTPSGLNWLYHRFMPEGEQYDPERKLIRVRTDDNYLLQKSYVKNLRANYSTHMQAQELDAEFVSFAGNRAYSDFDQKMNVVEIEPPEPIRDQIYVVHDLNINPLAGICCYKRNDTLYVFDEIWLENADVRMLALEIKKRYGRNVVVVGDGATNNRRSSWNIQDTAYKIFAEEGLHTQPFSNPHVSKRIANVNRLFLHRQLKISPKCKKTINDLNLVKYKEGSNELDKTTNKTLTHVSDALGYACWKLLPWIIEERSRSYNI